MRVARFSVVLLAVVAFLFGPTRIAAQAPNSQEALIAHFKHVWSSDECVQRVGQSWEDYASWIGRFYGGEDGWNANIEQVTGSVTDPVTRAKLDKQLGAVGVRVAGEWAKDNSCRKIRTTSGFFNADEDGKPALTDFKSVLQGAASSDTGDGKSIGTTITKMNAFLDKLLGKS